MITKLDVSGNNLQEAHEGKAAIADALRSSAIVRQFTCDAWSARWRFSLTLHGFLIENGTSYSTGCV